MNDLTTTQAQPLAKTASAEVSEALWQRLTNASLTWAEAVHELGSDPAIRNELAIASTKLARHAEPCGSKAVAIVLGPLLTLYGVADKSTAEAKAFWGFYIDALSGLPLEALKAGVAEYVADPKSEFFPKPGPLKAICDRHAVPLRMAANRAAKALDGLA
jgi:hypothetical protein